MNEQRPFCGESGQEESLLYREQLPSAYRELGIICANEGLAEEFEFMVNREVPLEFRMAFNMVVELLQEKWSMSKDVVEKVLHDKHEIFLHEDEPVGPSHRIW